jgi:hypothetical protein
MIINEKMTAAWEDDFVVFLIGVRFNQPWKIHKWLPVISAMPKMLKELYKHPAMGLLHHETWFARTTILVQYWRSAEHLLAYAKNKDAEHLPAWSAFNRSIGTDGSVGIWHETYLISKGRHESIYVNMPPFGLGKVGPLVKVAGRNESSAGRLDRV